MITHSLSKKQLSITADIDGIKITEIEATDREYWDFINAISEQKNITQLAEQFGEHLPSHLNRCIQEGWIQSFKTN